MKFRGWVVERVCAYKRPRTMHSKKQTCMEAEVRLHTHGTRAWSVVREYTIGARAHGFRHCHRSARPGQARRWAAFSSWPHAPASPCCAYQPVPGQHRHPALPSPSCATKWHLRVPRALLRRQRPRLPLLIQPACRATRRMPRQAARRRRPQRRRSIVRARSGATGASHSPPRET